MADIKLAVKQNGHTHLIYLGDNGRGESTKDDGHNHLLYIDDTGENWVFEPGVDGHIHEIGDVTRKDPYSYIEKEDEDEVVADCMELYKSFKADEEDYRDRGEESWEYYMNKQWKDADREKLMNENRACLTINEIVALVNLYCGMEDQQQTEVHLRPFEASDDDSAEVGNILLKHVFNNNDYQDEKGDVRKDQVIAGRGNFHLFWDENMGEEGDVRIEQMLWSKPYFGPHLKRDCRDLEAMVLTDWVSKHKIDRLFPDKKDDIQKWIDDDDPSDEDEQPIPGQTFDEGRQKRKDMPAGVDGEREPMVNIAKKEIKVFEVWRKQYRRVPILKIESDQNIEDLTGLTEAKIKKLGDMGIAELIYKQQVEMRVTKLAGKVLLSDEIVDTDEFEIIPVYAYKYKEKFLGWVEALKDPANEINKRHSQVTDALNNLGGAKFVRRNALTPQNLETLKTKMTTWNAIIPVEDNENPVFNMDQPEIPAMIVQMEQYSSEKIRDISNMRDVAGLQGQGASNMSGRSLLIQKSTMEAGNGFMRKHMSQAEKTIAVRILKMIQENYSVERMKRIIQGNAWSQQEQILNQQTPEVTDEAIIKFKENAGLTKFDVVVEESAHSKSMRDLTFMTLSEMLSQGVQDIDTNALFEFSPYPASVKRRLMQGVMERRQAMAQEKQQEQMSQERRSLPDEMKLQQAGMPPQQGF